MDLLNPELPVVETAETMDLADLRSALMEAAASVSAAQARLAQGMAVFRARGGDAAESGFSSFGQWASVDLGLTSRAASGLADAGDKLASRPQVRAAWESGALSATKAQCVLSVATEKSESSWCALALEASSTQLSRIAAAYRRSERVEAEETQAGRDAEDRERQCGAWWHDRDDGLCELLAVLTPDDAAVVRAALETEMETQWRANGPATDTGAQDGGGNSESGSTGDNADAAEDPPETAPRPTAARRADALIGVAANRLSAGAVPVVRGEHTEVVLHIGQDYLTGESDEGLSALTNGPELFRADASRLACDARIRVMVKGADGTMVDLGRSQRLVSDKQRRLLTARDHGCRFPGCSNTRYVDAHHVVEWEHGGPTDMANLILLCNRHHRLTHHGAFRIDADGAEGFAFFDRFDEPIRPPDTPARHRCRNAPEKPRARSGGDPRYSINDAVTAMASAVTAVPLG